jgi:cell pole-organizing protein PopZ
MTPEDAALSPEPATAKSPIMTDLTARHAEGATPAAGPVAGAGLAPLPPTQGLQAAIAQLLEPVLRQWVEITLPRLVETAIREEVARQLSKPGGELKI